MCIRIKKAELVVGEIMKYPGIFLVLFIFGSLYINAEVIKTIDGKEYRDAKVYDTQPNGITISYKDEGYDSLKFINFKNLPKNLQEKYNYNQEKADKFDAEHEKWVQQQNKLYKEKQELNEKEEQERINLQQEIENSSFPIQFEGVAVIQKGTVGRAWRTGVDEAQADQYMGEILLYGSEFNNGYEWAGNIYPLNKNITYQGSEIQCYALPDIAFQMKLLEQKIQEVKNK